MNRAEARLAAQSVSVSFGYGGATRVRADGMDLPEGPHRLTGPRDFDLPGIGTMRIDPGTRATGDEAQLDKAAATLAQRLAACGAKDLAQARARLFEAQRLDDTLRSTQGLLAQLAPDGLDALRQAHAQALAEAGAAVDEAEPDVLVVSEVGYRLDLVLRGLEQGLVDLQDDPRAHYGDAFQGRLEQGAELLFGLA